MKIIFAGTPRVAAYLLKGLVQSGHEVVAVLTRQDALVGRSKVLSPSEVAVAASELGIPVIKANRIGPAEVDLIVNSGAELGVVIAYGSILNRNALNSLSAGWYNLHFSLLPKYRGAAPVQRALEAGESETGVTMFKLDEGMDSGLILGVTSTSIGSRENYGELLNRLSALGLKLALELLPRIYSGMTMFTEQQGEPTFATKPTRDDARINFNLSAGKIEHLVRAMNPEPMAWCLVGEEPMRIIEAFEVKSSALFEDMESLVAGQLCSVEGKLLVKCGEGTLLEMCEVQPSSKRVMQAKDWYNGNRNIERLT